MPPSIVRSIWSLALLLTLLGCSGAVTRETAIDRATQSVGSSTAVTVLATRLSTFGVEAPNSQVAYPDAQVWAVTLAGTFGPPSCGPAGAQQCPPPHRTALVLIDADTGDFMLASMPAPP